MESGRQHAHTVIVRVCECRSRPGVRVAYATVAFRSSVPIWEGIMSPSRAHGIVIALSFPRGIVVPFANLPNGGEFNPADEGTAFAFCQGETDCFRMINVQFPTAGDAQMVVVGAMGSRTPRLGPKSRRSARDGE